MCRLQIFVCREEIAPLKGIRIIERHERREKRHRKHLPEYECVGGTIGRQMELTRSPKHTNTLVNGYGILRESQVPFTIVFSVVIFHSMKSEKEMRDDESLAWVDVRRRRRTSGVKNNMPRAVYCVYEQKIFQMNEKKKKRQKSKRA